jgi:uncharacterized tellurite resistance protein B-like protein
MINLFKTFVGKKNGKNSKLQAMVQDVPTALCVLLLEAAHSDGECSEEEKSHIIATLISQYGLQREDIDVFLVKGDKDRKESVDLFQFTRYLNGNLSKQEKIDVLQAVWRIIHIDGQLEKHEDHFAHKLANLLRLSHKELINAKIEARNQLIT